MEAGRRDERRSATSFTAGWTFTVNNDVLVTGLGLWEAPPYVLINKGHQINLWANNGTLITSGVVTRGSPGVTTAHGAFFFFEPISPVTLTAGQTYRIGAMYGGGGMQDFVVDIVNSGPFANANITYG